MNRPVDWSPLAAADPVPGDPDEVERAGRHYLQVAETVQHVGKRLRGAAGGLDMSSVAVLAFCDNAYRAASEVSRAYDKYRGTGEALLGYAPQHRDAQAESLAALRQAQEAEAQMRSAQRIVDAAQARIEAAPPGADTTDDVGAYRRGNALLAEAQDALEAARRRMDAAVEAWQRAAQRAIKLITDVGLGALLDGLGNALAFTLAELDTLAGFFGDAWDLAGDVWDMVNPWGANSIWGRIAQTADSALNAILSTLEGFGIYIRSSWSTVAKFAGRAGIATAFLTSGTVQWFKDEQAYPKMETDEQVARALGQSVTVGGAAVAGGAIGGAVGGSVGFLLGGPFGAVGGFVIGSVVGSTVASTVVDQFNDSTVRAIGKAGDAVGDWTARTADDVAEWGQETFDDVQKWGEDKVEDIQQWGRDLAEDFSNHDFGKVVDDLSPLPWP